MRTFTVFVLNLFLVPIMVVMSQKLPARQTAAEILSFKKFIHIQNGDSMPYSLLEPLKIELQKKYPLVIFLHGAGERGNDNNIHLKHLQILYHEKMREKFPAFVLAPQCPLKQTWSELHSKPFSQTPTLPMKLFLQVLDKALKEYPIDASRIYITGVSMGGYGTWDLITRYPDMFAAAVPVCGGGDEKKAPVIKHIPIWAFHGALDKTVPPQRSRTMIQALHLAGAAPGYTEYPGVEHNSWVHAYKDPNLIPWLFKQKLNAPKPN